MADKGTRIVIEGAQPFDGEYELDLARAWTVREWNWIKRFGGYMPATIDDGLRGNDPALYVALAVIAMARNSRIDRDAVDDVADALLDSERGAIQIIVEAEDGDVIPPDLTSAPDETSPNGTRSNNNTSGTDSKPSSDPSDESLSPTGITASLSPPTLARTR